MLGLPRARARSRASSWCATASTCGPPPSAAHRGWLAVAADPRSRRRCGRRSRRRSPGALMTVVARLRRLFDLDAAARPRSPRTSARDPRLAPHVRARPGLRVAGAFDPFEAAARAVLGQQVSVAAARTHRRAARRPARRGDRDAASGADPALPAAPTRSPRAPPRDLAALGMPARRARPRCARWRARSRSGELALDAARRAGASWSSEIVALPGVGRWTAHYLAMRGLGWPDAFPEDDLGPAQGAGRHLGTAGARRSPSAGGPGAPTARRICGPSRGHVRTHLGSESAMSNTSVFTTMSSPVGRLTLVGDGRRPRRRSTSTTTRTPRRRAPTGVRDDRRLARRRSTQLQEYFAGTRTRFDLPLAPAGHGLSEEGLGGAAADPVRRDRQLRRDRARDRQAGRLARHRRRQPPQPDRHHHPLPPRDRRRRLADRLRRRPRAQAAAAGARSAGEVGIARMPAARIREQNVGGSPRHASPSS